MSILNKKEVIVLCPNGRRVVIKANTSSSIGQIIEESCMKQKFDPLNYNLKHLMRVLDPSSTLQYSNIPNHAQLELIEAPARRQESFVTVNLATDAGQCLIADFSPSDTLWNVLQYHEENKENNFSLPEDISGLEPFIVYTMRKISGDELRSITLKSLGLYNGRCMMRYNIQHRLDNSTSNDKKDSATTIKPVQDYTNDKADIKLSVDDTGKSVIHEPSEQVAEPANTEASSSPSVDNMDCTPPENRDSLMEAIQPEPQDTSVNSKMYSHVEEKAQDMDLGKQTFNDDKVNEAESNSSCKVIPLSDHDSVLFSLDDAPDARPSEESDDFFKLTLDEVRSMHREQVSLLKELEEKPLMTQQLRQLEKDSRLLLAMNQHPITQLRICFPDRYVIQANFKPRNYVRDVMEFLRPLLIRADLNFYLYTPFPRLVLKPEMSLIEANCIPKARLYFGTNEESISTFLSEETLSKKSSFEGAANAVIRSKSKSTNENRKTDHQSIELEGARSISPHRIEELKPQVDRSRRNDGAQASPVKPPKWFKLGK